MKVKANSYRRKHLCLCSWLPPKERKLVIDLHKSRNRGPMSRNRGPISHHLKNLMQQFSSLVDSFCAVSSDGTHYMYGDEAKHTLLGIFTTQYACQKCGSYRYELIPHKPWKEQPESHSDCRTNPLSSIPAPQLFPVTADDIIEENFRWVEDTGQFDGHTTSSRRRRRRG